MWVMEIKYFVRYYKVTCFKILLNFIVNYTSFNCFSYLLYYYYPLEMSNVEVLLNSIKCAILLQEHIIFYLIQRKSRLIQASSTFKFVGKCGIT